MEFCTEIRGPQRMNPLDFGDLLSVSLSLSQMKPDRKKKTFADMAMTASSVIASFGEKKIIYLLTFLIVDKHQILS